MLDGSASAECMAIRRRRLRNSAANCQQVCIVHTLVLRVSHRDPLLRQRYVVSVVCRRWSSDGTAASETALHTCGACKERNILVANDEAPQIRLRKNSAAHLGHE